MKVGIFGDERDPQCQAVSRELRALGADVVLIAADAIEREQPVSFHDDTAVLGDQSLDGVRGFYVRFIPAPFAPAMEQDGNLVLHSDWYTRFMHARERAHFYMSWLMQLDHAGALLVNPPQAGSMLQYKPFQLHVLRGVGAEVPRTLISNDPVAIRAFHAEVKDAIFKPLIGGALTRRLDQDALERLEDVRQSPVIFQERIDGEDLRVTLVGDEIVSCVSIDTPVPHLDFRGDEAYVNRTAQYREVTLPPRIAEQCRQAARGCRLSLAGIDIKRRGDRYVFLELNSSPVYLDVEARAGHPISRAIARLLVEGSR